MNVTEKEGGKEYLGRLRSVFPKKISWTGIKSPVQLTAKVAVIIHAFYEDVLCTLETERVFPYINL